MSPLRGWEILQGSETGGSASLAPGYLIQPLRGKWPEIASLALGFGGLGCGRTELSPYK
jgi:hypothetical protein